MHTAFESVRHAPAERVELFDELQRTSGHPMRASGTRSADFSATVRAIDLQPVDLIELNASHVGFMRSGRMIRDFDPELCSVIVPLRGGIDLRYGEQAVRLEQGDLALYGSSRPFAAAIGAGTSLLRAHVPLSRLPLSLDRIERAMGWRIDGSRGLGRLLSLNLCQVLLDGESYRPSDAAHVGTMLSDLMAALIARELDDIERVPKSVRQAALLARIDAYIRDHLDDPGLGPTTIAAALHISVGHLHRVFRAGDETVATYIRRCRLERARRDLADPGLTRLPIHRIASRWGFTDHASFTRAFRQTYEVTPRDYRLLACT